MYLQYIYIEEGVEYVCTRMYNAIEQRAQLVSASCQSDGTSRRMTGLIHLPFNLSTVVCHLRQRTALFLSTFLSTFPLLSSIVLPRFPLGFC
jgi:hypothetical protein